jgi:hypothetical protein
MKSGVIARLNVGFPGSTVSDQMSQLWSPSHANESQMQKFMEMINKKYNLSIGNTASKYRLL